MKLNSLSLQTNMIFARNESEIISRESYIVVKTLSNPTFHWGNYLIFKKPPVQGDIVNWMNIFQREFAHYKTFKHYVFAWDQDLEPQSAEYLSYGFSLEKSVSLQASSVIPPKHYNPDLNIRLLKTSAEWEKALELQTITRDPKHSYKSFRDFKKKQDESYQNLIRDNRGGRFGAFKGDELIADLGIYFEGPLARYQSVVTHPDYRKMGACGTLVYESGKHALENWGVKTLCMEADPDYHAARIYESVGFSPKENSYALYWYQPDQNT